MKPYPTYKHSGIEWIGEIPEHWVVKKNKFIVKSRNTERIPLSAEERGQITKKEFDYYGASGVIDKVDKYLFDGEYILIGEDGANLLTRSKRLAFIAKGKFWVNNHAHILEPIDGDIRYFAELFELHDYTSSVSGSAQPKLTQEALLSIPFITPPKQEQTSIANYLDRKTAEIDTLIAQKKQLITLYKEERTATINAAVTGKLDVTNLSAAGFAGCKDEQDVMKKNNPENKVNPFNPATDRKMKPSGIEWLGEIPEHWEVKKIKKMVSKIGSGVTPKGGAEIYLTEGVPLLRSQNIHNDRLKLKDVAYISDDIHNGMSGSKVYQGDVLLNITGGSIGRSFYVTNEFLEANVNQHVCILRPNEYVLSEYLHAFLISDYGQLQIRLCQLGGNREAVNFEQIKNFYIPWVSVDEQSNIMFHLKKMMKELNSSITKSEKEIELLQEYKTALISEVVLGKVDVREE